MRFKSNTAPNPARLATLRLTAILVAAAFGFLLLTTWGKIQFSGQSSASGGRCPACPACAPAAAGSPYANVGSAVKRQDEQHIDDEQRQKRKKKEQAQPDTQQQALRDDQPAGQPAAAHSISASGAGDWPLLCGGPDAIPLVQAALEASDAALWPNARLAFRPWEAGFSRQDLEATARHLHADGRRSDVHLTIEVRNKTVVFPGLPHNPGCEGCNPSVFPIKQGLEAGMAAGRLAIPEGVPLLINVADPPECRDRGNYSMCKAPVFSIFKDGRYQDVLMPHFKPRSAEPHFVPWEQKRDVAFFRGAPICSHVPLNGSHANPPSRKCSRWAIAELSWRHPDILNCTLTHDVTQHGGPPHVEGPETSHEEQAYYKYLVNADGSTAAWRLATLLAKNSLAIKQASPDIEWYYHALQPCTHYLHYWVTGEGDLVDVVRALNGSPANQLTAQRIAANGQAFALTHLSEEAQWRYWQLLINRYVELYRGGGSDTAAAAGEGGGGQQQPAAAAAAAAADETQAAAQGEAEAQAASAPAASATSSAGAEAQTQQQQQAEGAGQRQQVAQQNR